MAFLFDTDALSEPLRKQPLSGYLAWLQTIHREDQYTSAVVIGELYQGAFLSPARDHHLANIETRVLPAITVLPYDSVVAKAFGRIRAQLIGSGQPLMDADIQIAATAISHNLQLVTGNLRHFSRIPDLRIHSIFADLRSAQSSE